ncbi:MAG: MFS transporter [Lachnospiraceae bacterium]|nr:MFS transporter [Lachnospiraceae bacterium]
MEQKLFTKNFTLLVLGQASSLFGNYILRLALSMYVLEVTGSAAVFAGILSLATIPTIFLSPIGGILADRADRRNIMVALDTLTGMSVLCAAVFLSGDNVVIVISVLLVALSVLGAFETPTVQACIPQMLAGDNIIKGNAVVNQVASISYLIAPLLGGISMAKNDFFGSIRFITKERPDIMKMLLLAAFSRFFVMGVTLVGLPFLVRAVLGLDARFYGGAESAMAVATILGSIAAGLLTGKLKSGRLSYVLAAIGICIIPAGVIFLFPFGVMTRYTVIVAAFCGMQAAISVFSIFAVSMIQQNTPDELIGKIMAYTSAVTLCAQPVGQMVYGFLFDRFQGIVYLVLIPSGIVVCVIGLLATGFFRKMEEKQGSAID